MIGNTEKQISTSAKNYADSLIKVGKDGVMTYEAILNDLNIVKEITSESDELVKVLENPSISINTKNEIIDSVFANQISDKTANFLKILIDKKRFNELDQIIQCYKNEVDDINNIKRVEVISAIELSDDRKQKLIDKLQTKLQKQVNVNWLLDDEIIGGLIIKIDDDVIDNSLKNKLESLSKNII